jgi:hypothetical protein
MNLASQDSVDDLAASSDSFFDVFTDAGAARDFPAESFFDVFFDLSDDADTIVQRLDTLPKDTAGAIETEIVAMNLASQGSVDDLAASSDSFFDVFTEAGAANDFPAESFFDVFFDLSDDADTIVQRLDTLPKDTAGAIETEIVALNLASQDSVDGVAKAQADNQTFAVDSFFDVFTELGAVNANVLSRASQASLDDLELGNLDATVSSRATQSSVDAMASAQASNQKFVVDSFFDVFTDIAAIVSNIAARASQVSVDAMSQAQADNHTFVVDSFFDVYSDISAVDTNVGTVAQAQAANQRFIVDSFFDVFTELGALDSRIEELASINLQVLEIGSKKGKKRFLLTTSLSGVRVDVSLVSILALEMNNKAADLEDVTATAVVTSLSTGMLDIEVELPKSVKDANVFVFDVVDSDGHGGVIVFSN